MSMCPFATCGVLGEQNDVVVELVEEGQNGVEGIHVFKVSPKVVRYVTCRA